MSPKRRIVVLAVAVLAAASWYFFRPERAVLDRRVSETTPSQVAPVIATGEFESRAHESRGSAHVLDLGGGARVLRLIDFATSDGPDLQVYLLGSPSAANGADLDAAGFVSLGALKGNIGEQNYAIPDGVDLSRYGAVSIWCRRFGVNFATAVLVPRAAGA
ncbi:MAG: DM13 domain-containing protein [Gemmatimonadaceae bacterium]